MAEYITSAKSFVQVGDPLERGYFGKLVRVRSLIDGSEFAVKQVELKKVASGSKTKDDESFLLNLITREAKILVTVGHPNLIRVYGWFEEDGLLHVIMDDCKSGTLANVIRSRKTKERVFTELEIIAMANQLIQGINYLHVAKEVLHRDIKAENVFLTDNGRVAKLGNFGVFKMLAEKTTVAKGLLGTTTHIPPEVLRNAPYNYKSEIWAFGIVLYHMAALSLPFEIVNEDHDSLFKTILSKQPKELADVYSKELRELIVTKLLSKDQTTRPDSIEVLSTPIFLKIFQPGAKRGTHQQQQLAVDEIFTEAEVTTLFTLARRGIVDELERKVAKHGLQLILRVHDSNGDSLFHAAAIFGQLNVVRFFLDSGADIESPGYYGRTPLLSAASKGQTKIIQLLIERGARIDARSFAGDDECCAVHLAASFGHMDALKALLDHKPESISWADRDGDHSIHRAAMRNQTDVIELLLIRGAKIEQKGQYERTAFLCAVSKGCLDAATRLVKWGANINATSNKEDGGGTACHLAAEFGHLDVLSYLLSIRPEFLTTRDINGNMPINSAALAGKKEVVDFLLKKGCSIEQRGFHGRTPLLNACSKGDAEMVIFLLDHKADFSARSGEEEDEATGLHLAASFGQVDVINALLDKVPNLNKVQDKNGDFPINVAALNGQDSSVIALLERGADIEARGFHGRTPLLSAASSGQLRTVELLVEKGAKIVAQANDEFAGDMAIHLAAYFGHLPVVAFFIKQRGNLIGAKNSHGETAQERAAANGKDGIVEFLKSKKSKLDLYG